MASVRDASDRDQGVGLGKIGCGTAAREVERDRLESPRGPRLALEVAREVHELVLLQPGLRYVVGMKEDDTAVSPDPAVAVVEAVDRGVELIVATDRRHQVLARLQCLLGKG